LKIWKQINNNNFLFFFVGLNRKVAIVNLDPANDTLPYTAAVDISELVTQSEVMDELHLGPNGGLIFCMEYIEKNLDWLKKRLDGLPDHYILFDCPGQVSYELTVVYSRF